MLAADERAKNLFARLFSYAPRAKRNPREDYCTEALAWLLVNSKDFARSFLDLIREQLKSAGALKSQLRNYYGAVYVSTQVSYTGEDNDDEEDTGSAGGRFDLVIEPAEPARRKDFIVVIESKVGLDLHVGKQAEKYRERLKAHPQFSQVSERERYVLTLTPASGTPPGADAHLNWQDLHGLLENFAETLADTHPLVLLVKPFAKFLKLQHIALVKLPFLDSATIQNFQQLAPLLASVQEHFGAFANDDVLRQFFSPRDAERPTVVDYDGKDKAWGKKHVWYGIECNKKQRNAYAGFVFRGDEIALCAGVIDTTDVTNRFRTIKGQLNKSAKSAKKFFGSNSQPSGEGTNIWFARLLAKGDASDAIIWFREIFDEIGKHFEDPSRRR